ncbi:hypothetical protein BP5796_11777 [Coleophoma crateriformis]|uniref:Uncharacterized protein n=1 Tax=Coleophoma crateriformis TaxID=565419 RepID=A0A3D8QEP0_9HELO|nr:hypothetical protein BP5796_11777 [Coleophoma crateriformis]
MDTISCYCKSCEEKLGRFSNRCIGIGKGYFSPVEHAHNALGPLELESIGEVRIAEPGNRLEKSLLQDLGCGKCKTIIGTRCEAAPDGHMLKSGQLILRLKSISIMSDRTGLKTAPNLLKTYAIIDSVPKTRRTSGTQSALEASSQTSERESFGRNAQIELRKEFRDFAEWAEGIMGNQRKDIDRIDGAVGRIENDMRLFRDFMADMRKQLGSDDRIMNVANNQEIVDLRNELAGLQLQVEQATQDGPGLTKNGYEVLNQNMIRIDQKVTQISSLKPEVNSIKTRVDHLEGRARAALLSAEAPDTVKTEEALETGPTRAQAAQSLAQNIQRNGRGCSQPGKPRGHIASNLARDVGSDNELVGEPSREQSALQLAGELHRHGQTAVAKQIVARTLGKRNRSEPGIPNQTKLASKRYRREASVPQAAPSGVDSFYCGSPRSPSAENIGLGNRHASNTHSYKAVGAGDFTHEDSYLGIGHPSQGMGAEPRRVRGRSRKDTASSQSLKTRTSDGVLLTDSGKVDGRSLRGRKIKAGGTQPNAMKSQRPIGRSFEDDDDELSHSTRKPFHHSITGIGRVLPSIEHDSEKEARMRRLQEREILAKETLDRYV